MFQIEKFYFLVQNNLMFFKHENYYSVKQTNMDALMDNAFPLSFGVMKSENVQMRVMR